VFKKSKSDITCEDNILPIRRTLSHTTLEIDLPVAFNTSIGNLSLSGWLIDAAISYLSSHFHFSIIAIFVFENARLPTLGMSLASSVFCLIPEYFQNFFSPLQDQMIRQ